MATKKPKAGMRRPPKTKDLEQMNAFVAGQTPSPAQPKPEPVPEPPRPPAHKQPGIHERASGKKVRRTSMYLKPETALALKRYGVDQGLDMSAVAEDVLAEFLRQKGYLDT